MLATSSEDNLGCWGNFISKHYTVSCVLWPSNRVRKKILSGKKEPEGDPLRRDPLATPPSWPENLNLSSLARVRWPPPPHALCVAWMHRQRSEEEQRNLETFIQMWLSCWEAETFINAALNDSFKHGEVVNCSRIYNPPFTSLKQW